MSSADKQLAWGSGVFLSCWYLLYFLLIRLLDEFKDQAFDNNYHKDRPLQSGLIGEKDLWYAIAVVLICMSVIVIYVGGNVWYYLVVLGYTGLMYKEFFIPRYLKKHIFAYLLSHQIVFIPIWLYIYSITSPGLFKQSYVLISLHLLYQIAPVVIMEIGRKMMHRHDAHGKNTPDTYAYIWGEWQAIAIFGGLIIASALVGIGATVIPVYVGCVVFISGSAITVSAKQLVPYMEKYGMVLTIGMTLLFPLLALIYTYE